MVAQLESDGWLLADRGERWFEGVFVRRQGDHPAMNGH